MSLVTCVNSKHMSGIYTLQKTVTRAEIKGSYNKLLTVVH